MKRADLKSQLKRVKEEMAAGRRVDGKGAQPERRTPGRPMGERKAQTSASPAQAGDRANARSNEAGPGQSSSPPDVGSRAGSVRESPLLLPRLAVLTRQSEFHQPAAWLGMGRRSQYSEHARGRAKEVFIGLDFGTAYTKAAVGLLDKVFPVDWLGVLSPRSRYLLPTEYSALRGGYCCLGQHPAASVSELVSELKQPFIASSVSDEDICRAAVFVALVLQYVRAWVYEHHGRKLGESPLRWHLNVGTPSNGFEEDGRAVAYRRLARTAWILSLRRADEVNLAQAERLLKEGSDGLPTDLVEMDPVPEFVAQLAGYAQSAQRQDGLHALVDVGGGTVDMVTFNVHHADGDDVFPFFVPRVEPLGTYGMLANRFRPLAATRTDLSQALDDLIDVEHFARALRVPIADIRRWDTTFEKNVASVFSAVLHETRRRRYRLAPEWKNGIRTFVTGGGSNLPVYQAALQMVRTPENCALIKSPLPNHPKLDGFAAPADEYHRVSVACGLATNRLSLGRIVPASQVDDDRPLTESLPERERLSHEELYAR